MPDLAVGAAPGHRGVNTRDVAHATAHQIIPAEDVRQRAAVLERGRANNLLVFRIGKPSLANRFQTIELIQAQSRHSNSAWRYSPQVGLVHQPNSLFDQKALAAFPFCSPVGGFPRPLQVTPVFGSRYFGATGARVPDAGACRCAKSCSGVVPYSAIYSRRVAMMPSSSANRASSACLAKSSA